MLAGHLESSTHFSSNFATTTLGMDGKISCEALMQFTGLDQESTMTQILPYLKSMKTRAEIEEYLGSLIGQGQKQTTFIQRFSDQRFRPNPTVSRNQNNLDSAFPSLQSTHKSSSSSSLPTISATLGPSFPIKNRPGGPSTKQPKTESGGTRTPTVDPKILNNFGNSANVYMKSRDSDDSVTRLSKKKNAKSNHSGAVTPEPRLLEAANTNNRNTPDQIKSMEEPVAQTDSKADLPPDIDIPISELSPSTLKELLQLKIILDSFESEEPTPTGSIQCFCEARTHGLPIGRLPKQCATCGLIYCKLKPALSACPSCGEQTPLSKNIDLKNAVSKEFLEKRQHLIRLEIDKYQKRMALEELKKAQAHEADRAYPSLPSTSTLSRTHSYNHPQQPAAKYSSQLNPAINGKTKIIKTTTKKTLVKDGSLPKEQTLLTVNQGFDPALFLDDDCPPAYLDPCDDLLTSHPSLFIEHKSSSSSAILPDYVPVKPYQV
ncbi:hypothetical protein PtA15_14A203 [Puccinia triticina]|uniref:TRIP4/RQT4 C2HC5-type zinc finger domain-containing protein n=1 Tax=Puccinia triticina TaxID=208348 RepID=A0ABY7D367_9BASI|nr:uncharacterized protein PtA15_14A203 [Puccinia triticina]WAQ91320.1 hypothetical protein PtA15_14A203 [Puccinia triticina]